MPKITNQNARPTQRENLSLLPQILRKVQNQKTRPKKPGQGYPENLVGIFRARRVQNSKRGCAFFSHGRQKENGKLVYFPFCPPHTQSLLYSLPPIPIAQSARYGRYLLCFLFSYTKPNLFFPEFFPSSSCRYFCENIYFTILTSCCCFQVMFSGEFSFHFSVLLNFTIYFRYFVLFPLEKHFPLLCVLVIIRSMLPKQEI